MGSAIRVIKYILSGIGASISNGLGKTLQLNPNGAVIFRLKYSGALMISNRITTFRSAFNSSVALFDANVGNDVERISGVGSPIGEIITWYM